MTGKINFLSVIFYYGGIMKRFLSILMCIFILTISVITYFPFSVKAADNDFTLSNEGINLSSGEANNAVKNKGDIYTADHLILFRYTPTSDYNWTYVNHNIHLSDAQVVALLMSDNKYEVIAKLAGSAASHSVITRGMLAALGVLTTGDSDIFNSFFDMLTSNYNYLNAIEYDPQTGDLTLLADQVTALRNELKERYYESIGVGVSKPVNTPQFALEKLSSLYEHQEDFISDFNNIKGEKYVFGHIDGNNSDNILLRLNFTDTPDYFYYDSEGNLCAIDSNLTALYDFTTTVYAYSVYSNCDFMGASSSLFKYRLSYGVCGYLGLDFKRSSTNGMVFCVPLYYYSDVNTPLWFFKSYEALYNYVHGSQTAYLSSKVEEAGEDIKLSINNMNDNIGSKMDELIDSINNKKDGMSADELQKAIDKALDSISGKIDDIGDNTQQTNNKLDALLESVSGTNQILMQILGVTTDIRDIVKTQNEEGNDYTMNDVQNCFNTMMEKVKNAILYGDNSDSSGSDSSSSKLASSYSSDIAVYSVDNLNYENGILGKFPFSVPYQLYEWLQVLQSDEKTPSFNYNYGFLIGKKSDGNYNLTFDLSEYQPWADVVKSFLRLSFTLIFAVCIYNKFKGEI